MPTFVTYDSRQLAAINAGSTSTAASFSDIKDRLAAIDEQPFAGTDVSISDTVLNDGPPAHGIRVLLKGNAFDNGLLGQPTRCMVAVAKEGGGTAAQKDFELSADPAGGYSGIAELTCDKEIHVTVIVPAKKGGSGQVQMFVYPQDKGGASSAAFTHSYSVRSETDDSQNSSESD